MAERARKIRENSITVGAPTDIDDDRSTFQRVLEEQRLLDAITTARDEIEALTPAPEPVQSEAQQLAAIRARRLQRRGNGTKYEEALALVDRAGNIAEERLRVQALEALKKVG